jgi:hypothetical protein
VPVHFVNADREGAQRLSFPLCFSTTRAGGRASAYRGTRDKPTILFPTLVAGNRTLASSPGTLFRTPLLREVERVSQPPRRISQLLRFARSAREFQRFSSAGTGFSMKLSSMDVQTAPQGLWGTSGPLTRIGCLTAGIHCVLGQ